MVYFELGRIPLEYMRLFRSIKYWFQLLTTTNCILKEAYNILVDLSDGNTFHNYNWVTFLKNKRISRIHVSRILGQLGQHFATNRTVYTVFTSDKSA